MLHKHTQTLWWSIYSIFKHVPTNPQVANSEMSGRSWTTTTHATKHVTRHSQLLIDSWFFESSGKSMIWVCPKYRFLWPIDKVNEHWCNCMISHKSHATSRDLRASYGYIPWKTSCSHQSRGISSAISNLLAGCPWLYDYIENVRSIHSIVIRVRYIPVPHHWANHYHPTSFNNFYFIKFS